jgi:hypothetical protein
MFSSSAPKYPPNLLESFEYAKNTFVSLAVSHLYTRRNELVNLSSSVSNLPRPKTISLYSHPSFFILSNRHDLRGYGRITCRDLFLRMWFLLSPSSFDIPVSSQT